jgi:hypothetical protein
MNRGEVNMNDYDWVAIFLLGISTGCSLVTGLWMLLRQPEKEGPADRCDGARPATASRGR